MLSVPQSVVNTDVTNIVLHGFSDASKLAVSAAIYALVFHKVAPVCQNLLVTKSRIAPRELSIPRAQKVGKAMCERPNWLCSPDNWPLQPEMGDL